jgi:hypothetical protein
VQTPLAATHRHKTGRYTPVHGASGCVCQTLSTVQAPLGGFGMSHGGERRALGGADRAIQTDMWMARVRSRTHAQIVREARVIQTSIRAWGIPQPTVRAKELTLHVGMAVFAGEAVPYHSREKLKHLRTLFHAAETPVGIGQGVTRRRRVEQYRDGGDGHPGHKRHGETRQGGGPRWASPQAPCLQRGGALWVCTVPRGAPLTAAGRRVALHVVVALEPVLLLAKPFQGTQARWWHCKGSHLVACMHAIPRRLT